MFSSLVPLGLMGFDSTNQHRLGTWVHGLGMMRDRNFQFNKNDTVDTPGPGTREVRDGPLAHEMGPWPHVKG